MRNAVRVRFAPSPTGFLHVGNVRTALFNWLFARHHDGTFILRIEDTDLERSEPRFEQAIQEDLSWLGLNWDEGIAKGGEYGPYRQTERFQLYRKHAHQLLESGQAYYCFCSPEQLEADRAEQERTGAPLQYVGRCRPLSADTVRRRLNAGEPAVVRFRVPATVVEFHDEVFGSLRVDTQTIGDFILLRSDGSAQYNFACVVDDAGMAISHVIRGEGHLSNTPRQILLYQAFGWNIPRFAHLSTILGPDGGKLSKRHGATSVREFRDAGYLPEALVNYLALLGWSPPEGMNEVMTISELVKEFSLQRVQVSPATFDPAKLKWINRNHLKRRSLESLEELARPFLERAALLPPGEQPPDDWIRQLLDLFLPYVDCLAELTEQVGVFDFDPQNGLNVPEIQEVLQRPETFQVVTTLEEVLSERASPILTPDDYRNVAQEVKVRTGTKGKALFLPLRLAVTARASGPELEKLVPALERAALLHVPRGVLPVRQRVAAVRQLLENRPGSITGAQKAIRDLREGGL